MRWLHFHIATTTALIAGLINASQAQGYREIGRTTEKELKVVMTSTFGSVTVSRGDEGKIVMADNQHGSHFRYSMDYSVRNRIGYLDVSLGEGRTDDETGHHSSLRFSGLKGGDWVLRFTDAVPISFDIQMGVGKGDLNFTGLTLKDLNLSAGASDVCLAFDEPNAATVENINIEAGVSKFIGRNLCNANFRKFRFQGGVGSCTLDFGGMLARPVDVDVQVGMGVVTLIIPREAGARVTYEKNWICRIDASDDFSAVGDREYVSSNYNSTHGRMDIHVESGVGSVRIKRPD